MSYGMLFLRLVLGLTFATHGGQKLFGAFGGLGPRGTAEYFGGLGFRSPFVLVFAAGFCEIGGGFLLAAGLLTPAAALPIAVLMLTAIWADLRHQGYYVRNGGSEYAVLIWTVVIAITAAGPGRFSLDAAIGWADNITGLWWALGVLGLSAIIAVGTLGLSLRPGRSPELAGAAEGSAIQPSPVGGSASE